MKFFANTILLILFIPLFLTALFAGTVKYRLLVPEFWQKTFDASEVYPKLSQSLKTYEEMQIVKEGGRKADVKIITDLITPANVKDFIEKNLVNILSYANGGAPQIFVYIPLEKVPKGLLPKNLTGISEQMPLTTFLSEFNIPVSQNQIQWVSLTGRIMFYLLIISGAVASICIILLIVLAEGGKRFVFPGVTLFLTGILSIIIWFSGNNFAFSLTRDFQNNPPLDKQIVEIILPPTLTSVLNVWLWAGVSMVFLGVLFLFFKKPVGIKKPVI